jgi:hypothetical protein
LHDITYFTHNSPVLTSKRPPSSLGA